MVDTDLLLWAITGVLVVAVVVALILEIRRWRGW